MALALPRRASSFKWASAARRHALAFGLMLTLASPAVAQSLAAGTDTVYVVRRGDTLYRIAQAHNTTIAELKAINDMATTDLSIGQRLRVLRTEDPEEATPTGAAPDTEAMPTSSGAYVVEPGDTAYSLALRFGISVDSVLTLAGGRVGPLEPGQRLALAGEDAPASTPMAEPERPHLASYTVRAGDTLYRIARLHETSVDAIRQANDLASDRIVPGQDLLVPRGLSASSDAAAVPADPAPEQPVLPPVRERGAVLTYPDTFRGRLTASRALYDPARYTTSHRTLPLGTIVLLMRDDTGASTFAEVNDRGPLSAAHVMDVSRAVATHLALSDTVATEVTVRVIREPAER